MNYEYFWSISIFIEFSPRHSNVHTKHCILFVYAARWFCQYKLHWPSCKFNTICNELDSLIYGSSSLYLLLLCVCVCMCEINYKIGWVTCGFTVADAISDIFMSIGTRVSYKVGAWSMIPAVPTTTAIVNNHKNKRSNTIATYFQSSFTCKNHKNYWNRQPLHKKHLFEILKVANSYGKGYWSTRSFFYWYKINF